MINEGRIDGDVSLADGEDFFDTRRGDVTGVIYGGYGDDTYYISKSSVKIDDRGGSFGDAVFSSASYTLVGGLDDLYLIGRRNVDATGNVADNTLTGNTGDNHLRGMSGNDKLVGAGGIDLLSGGAGSDLFFMNSGDDVDTITDFEDGIDKLAPGAVQSQQDFDDLTIRAVRGDLVIDFGGGDRLVLLDTQKSEITFADFAVL